MWFYSRNRHILLLYLFLISGSMLFGREVACFNDGWVFKKGPLSGNSLSLIQDPTLGHWQEVSIPHTWNAIDMQQNSANITEFRNPQSRFYTGDALYRKSFTPDISMKEKRVFLRFEGVGTVAEVYVNNQFSGRHKGAYSAFVTEITRLLSFEGENEIIVKVSNEPRADVIPVNNVLFGVYGGIYRDIQIITTGKVNIAVTDYASPGIYISQENVSRESADACITVKIENKTTAHKEIELVNEIYDSANRLKVKKMKKFNASPQGRQLVTQRLKVESPRLWQGVEDPYLYKSVTQLIVDGEVVDEVVQPVGFRSFEFRQGDGFYLNGKKYPMYGVCRHQDWLDKGSALTTREHDADLALIKEIGATTVRLAHYQQAEYVYSKCDSIGLLVWAEIPFVNEVTTHETENAMQQMKELIRQNYNHPSIFIWGLHNEVYSPFEQTIPLTEMLHDLAKSEDPGRYTVSVSGYNNINATANNNADIQGINHYFGWYGGKISDIEEWAEKIEREYPHHKVIFSEYGGEANIEHQKEDVGEIGDCCGFNRKYNETWGTKFHEIQWGVIARHPYLLASYIWNMFDFATPMSAQGGVYSRNMKGLVTFDRKVKKDPFYWYKANWSREPVLYLTQRRAAIRENEITTVTVYSNIGTPELTLNGEEISDWSIGTTSVHYIFNKVQLKEGENIIEARAMKDGKEYTDKIIWYYSAENRKNGNNQNDNKPKERGGEHIGL